MKSKQYEELCRLFLAEQLGIDAERIRSVHIPNPRRPNLPDFKHQIDLYWEIETELTLYLNIANAKWRGKAKVDQGEMLLLQGVKDRVRAHKAMMITNSEFTAGARAAAQHDEIALHIVQPDFDYSSLDQKDSAVIGQQLRELSATAPHPLYTHEVVFKGSDSPTSGVPPQVNSQSGIYSSDQFSSGYQHKMIEGYPNKAIGPLGGSQQEGGISQNWPPGFEKK